MLHEVSGVFSLPHGLSMTDSFISTFHPVKQGMILVPAGRLTIKNQTNDTQIKLFVKSFYLDSTEVTVREFADFISRQHYVTDAEKFGNAGVFSMDAREWSLVDSADWQFPKGKKEEAAKANEPATQISWYDAKAYCASLGKRLPNEFEWEHAARNGKDDPWMYSWGDDWHHSDTIYGNVWQGDFPYTFANLDGFESTAPVGSFRSSPLGFKDLSGNVWEWCDNWRFEYDQLPNGLFAAATEKVMRGGSFLCAPNYCHGYMISSRQFTTPETSLFHIGCRCAMDVE
ncbi:MAG: SUMF1/EgtB/PvdO family nonheme iron enzyme [Saprospiraceae bacterium]